jgi:heme oxygenase
MHGESFMAMSTEGGHLARPTSETTVRSVLRDATSALHVEVDTAMSEVMGRGGYPEFLLRSADALLPLESALEKAGVVGILPDWAQRSRSLAIQADLADLSVAMPEHVEGIRALRIEGEAALFGALYVLEGSRLGARYIARGIDPTLPARYIRHGEGLPLWPTFLARLECSVAVQDHLDDALSGARAAFQAFRDAATSDLLAAEVA